MSRVSARSVGPRVSARVRSWCMGLMVWVHGLGLVLGLGFGYMGIMVWV